MEAMSLLSNLNHWQIDAVTIGLLLMSTVLTLIPEELLFMTLGLLAQAGHVHSLEAILAAKLGLIPADALTVWAGKKMGKDFLKKRPFSLLFDEHSVESSLKKLKQSGSTLLFLNRFTPFLRTPVYLAAGISGFPLGRAVLIDFLAAIIQIAGLFSLGYYFGRSAQPFVTGFTYLALAIALALILKRVIQSAFTSFGISFSRIL